MSVNSQRTLGSFGELSYFYYLTVLESCVFSTERSQKEEEVSLSSLCAVSRCSSPRVKASTVCHQEPPVF